MGSISESGTGCAAPTGVWAISTRSGQAAGRQSAAMLGRLGAGLLLLAGMTANAPTASLDVKVDRLRSAKGVLRICLTADPKNFPGCVDDARAVTRSIPASAPDVHIDGLPYGRYAIAVIHDANNNAKLDTVLGIPREGFGFSRNPTINFGPPRFKAAEFDLTSPNETQSITMRYFL